MTAHRYSGCGVEGFWVCPEVRDDCLYALLARRGSDIPINHECELTCCRHHVRESGAARVVARVW